MTTIMLLTCAADVQAAILETQAYLQQPIQFTETLTTVEHARPDLLLWHPTVPNDVDAHQLAGSCQRIIFILPVIPAHKRRFGGSYSYPPPWNQPLLHLPEHTFRALMPLDPEALALIITHMLAQIVS
jgi:hypothetical protein